MDSIDIWTEILLRVPAERLVKVKHVCKLWYSMINDKKFTRAHLNFWRCRRLEILSDDCGSEIIKGNRNLTKIPLNNLLGSGPYEFLYHCRTEDLNLVHYNFDNGGSDHYNFQGSDSFLPSWRQPPVLSPLLTTASCDGLVLLTIFLCHSVELIMCNPVTKRYRMLPSLEFDMRSSNDPFHRVCALDRIRWRIMYDDSVGLYKVIGIYGVKKSNEDEDNRCFVLELHESGESSSSDWRELLGLTVPPEHHFKEMSAASTDGKLALWFQPDERSHRKIHLVLLDIRNNNGGEGALFKCSTVHMPSCYCGVHLSESNRRFQFLVLESETQLDLWTLNALNDNLTWFVKQLLFEIPIPRASRNMNYQRFVATPEGGRLVFHHPVGLLVYDITTSHLSMFEPSPPNFHPVIYHINSLISWK